MVICTLFPWAGSLNKGAVTASSEPNLTAAHLISFFKRNLLVLSQKHLENTHSSVAVVINSCQSASSFSLMFPAHDCNFLLKIHVLLAALAEAVISVVAVALLNDLKIKLRYN